MKNTFNLLISFLEILQKLLLFVFAFILVLSKGLLNASKPRLKLKRSYIRRISLSDKLMFNFLSCQ